MADYELIFVREGVLEIAEDAKRFQVAAGLTPSAYRRLHAPANVNTE